MIYLDSSVALAHFPTEDLWRTSRYQAVSSNTRRGTGFMLPGSIGRMAMQYER
jgi:hypothetical protein